MTNKWVSNTNAKMLTRIIMVDLSNVVQKCRLLLRNNAWKHIWISWCVHKCSWGLSWLIKSSLSANWKCIHPGIHMAKLRFTWLLEWYTSSENKAKDRSKERCMHAREYSGTSALLFQKVAGYGGMLQCCGTAVRACLQQAGRSCGYGYQITLLLRNIVFWNS